MGGRVWDLSRWHRVTPPPSTNPAAGTPPTPRPPPCESGLGDQRIDCRAHGSHGSCHTLVAALSLIQVHILDRLHVGCCVLRPRRSGRAVIHRHHLHEQQMERHMPAEDGAQGVGAPKGGSQARLRSNGTSDMFPRDQKPRTSALVPLCGSFEVMMQYFSEKLRIFLEFLLAFRFSGNHGPHPPCFPLRRVSCQQSLAHPSAVVGALIPKLRCAGSLARGRPWKRRPSPRSCLRTSGMKCTSPSCPRCVCVWGSREMPCCICACVRVQCAWCNID